MWDHPRPPRIEASSEIVRVELGGVVVAQTTGALRVLETSHPPTYYLPPSDCRTELLAPAPGRSLCEWKGAAVYWTVTAGAAVAPAAAWSYPEPVPAFAELRDHLAFYPSAFDCTVDGEAVRPQPGGFYGGWVTSRVTGPFKGVPGSAHW